jgi:hypothetical protein
MAQAQQSSIFSRKIVNLFAGMAYGYPDLPTVLRDGGYECFSIERTFAVASNKIINPELILCSDKDEHSLIVEAKSGANLKPDQLERYALISSESLHKQAFTSAQAAKKHDVLIVGQADVKDRLLMGTTQVQSERRILAVVLAETANTQQEIDAGQTLQGIERVEGTFATGRLNHAFSPVLEVNWEIVPNNFLPVDHEAEDWEFAQPMLPEIIAAILDGKVEVLIDDLAKTFIRHWDFIDHDYKKKLLSRMYRVTKIAEQKRFSSYIRYDARGKQRNKIRLTIPDNSNQDASKLRMKLQRCLRDLMADLNSPQIAMIYED